MALRKIKDLIREMVFDNQSDVREYANVMANLVFDRNQADEYEKSLESAENINQRYDEQIQEINAKLEKSKVKQKDIIARKKDMSNEEFRTLMANAQQEVKQLEGVQRDTIAEKIQKGFRNLSPTIKKYGCLRYLSNEYVKNADFKTESGADGVIYADEYEFKSSEMANNFREISDYVDYIFGNRESKITEPKSIVDIIRADAKELDLTIDKLTPANIVTIYNNLLARIAEENRNKQTENEQIEQSQIGIKPVRDFGDGLVMYRLLPDTEYYNEHGEHRNLVYESDQMGICIGQKGQSYSQKILNQDENQYYTLRSRNKNGQLIPHCTIEVNGNTISQVKGKANGAVNGKYIKQVREFLKQHLNVAFPGEVKTNNKRELYDYSNIGFIRDLHDKTVDLFNLPPNTEFYELKYDLLTNKGIKKENIKSVYSLDCRGATITQKDIAIIAKVSRHTLDLSDAKLRGKYDFSNTNISRIYLDNIDLTDTEIIFNLNTKFIGLSLAKIRGKWDFSNINIKEIDLSYVDLTDVKIIFNPNTQFIKLYKAKLQGTYDFSDINVKEIDLKYADLTDAKIILNSNIESIELTGSKLRGRYDFSNINVPKIYPIEAELTDVEMVLNPNTELIDMSGAKLRGKCSFSNVKEINLREADLTNAEIIFNPNAERINLSRAKLHGKLDLSNTNLKKINLTGADLTDAEIIFPKSIEEIYLSGAKLHDKCSFSNVKKIDLRDTDLTNAEIIFNPNAEKINLSYAKLRGKCSFSNVKEINLREADLTDAEIIFNPNAEYIYLSEANLRGKYDFGNVKKINLSFADLTNAEVIFNPNAESIYLYEAKLHGKCSFGNVKEINLSYADLTNAEIIFNPNAERINLSYAKLRGKCSFSNVKEINLREADLTDAEIIVNQNTKIVGLNEKYKNKIVVLQSESKVDLLNKGIKNLKNRLNIDTQQLTEKISASDREND